MRRSSLYLFAAAGAFVSIAGPARAQEGVLSGAVTGQAVVGAANQVLTKLQNVGTALIGNGSIAVGGATTQMSQLIADFERAAGTSIGQPINRLSASAQLLAQQLHQTSERMDALVSKNRDCIAANLDLFLAGVSTVTADAKRGIPFVRLTDPRLVSFKFNGMNTANVVPRTAGGMVINGFRLFENGFVPSVSLWTEDGAAKLADLRAGPAGSTNAVAVVLPANLVATNPGKCLQLHVETFGPKSFLGIDYGRQRTGSLALPMCIPAAYGTRVALDATLNYTTGTPDRRALSAKRFAFRNTDMAHSINVSDTKSWAGEIPAGYRVVEVSPNVVRKENDSNIGVGFTSDAVTAAGWLSDAEDFNPPIGPRIKIDDTEWIADITPLVAGTIINEHVAVGSTSLVDLDLAGTQMCVDLPVQGTPDATSIVSVVVRQELAGSGVLPPLYTSERVTVNGITTTFAGTVPGFLLNTTYNPTPAGGKCQVCTKVQSSNACAF